jgi:hypothetical protein
MRAYFATLCMKFTFPEFSEEMPPLQLRFLEPGGYCFRSWPIFLNTAAWGSPVQEAVEGQSLTPEDQLLVLMQSGRYLTATRGMGTPEAQICCVRAEPLCYSLNRPDMLYVALGGQWEYSLMTEKLTAAMQIAKRIYSLAEVQNAPSNRTGGCVGLAVTFYFIGDFESAREHAIRGVQIWRAGDVQSPVEVNDPAAVQIEVNVQAPVACLAIEALSKWHLGEIASCKTKMKEAISLAKKSNDMHSLALALIHAAILAHLEGNPTEVERLASEAIELSTRQNFAQWLYGGTAHRGWARCASGHLAEGISLIDAALQAAARLTKPYVLALKAETLHLANRTFEGLETIKEAEALVERSGERWWCAEMHRLKGVFLAAMGADETEIETSFCEPIRIAKEQKSVSLEKRAEATHTEYRHQKAGAPAARRVRLSLW